MQGVNRVSSVQDEFIGKVFLDPQDDPALENWRENSGLRLAPGRAAVVSSQDQLASIWTPGQLRLFICHKADKRREATDLKGTLDSFGVSCFVAHEDIEPTKEWQIEIERALFSMEALVALMTGGFHDSNWTDQEIGVAVGRQVPVIPVRLGIDPYGFIGKYQGLSGKNKSADALAVDVYELLWTKANLKERLISSLVARFEKAASFREANDLMEHVGKIDSAAPAIVERLENAPKRNTQVAGAYEVQQKLPQLIEKLRGSGT